MTICTRDRENVFGEITDGIMKLNDYGKIVDLKWVWLFQQYEYLGHDEYVIMPNHFHGIIHITVGNGHDRSLQREIKIKPLPELIGAFKTTSSKLIHRAGLDNFQWQKSYHDRIIRNDQELNRIREYIVGNPMNWGNDKNNPFGKSVGNGRDRSKLGGDDE